MTSSTSPSRKALPLISVHNAVPRHPEFPVAAPVDFEMSDGEVIAICGENGAGKTLLVNIITGALPLREGSV
ncbi:MAG: ATP-binding cassette domain-containing protein, partial [Bacteroidaceae bacterium]|nr:ATP-binding cassette domain-containing protein [Bacteroidaceae bacterium]